MSDSSGDEDAAAMAARSRMTSAATTLTLPHSSTSSALSLSLSASNVINVIGGGSGGGGGGGGGGRQKSLFSGMNRVRLREKWGGKSKAAVTAAAVAAASKAESAATGRKSKKHHLHHAPNALPVGSSESKGDREDDRRRRRTLSSMDLERYRTLSVWLEQNGIELPKQQLHSPLRRSMVITSSASSSSPTAFASAATPGTARADLFDDVYDSLETLEKAMETEISQLQPPSPTGPRDDMAALIRARHDGGEIPPKRGDVPSLMDYLVVIGPDVTDIAIQNHWRGKENVFEATVAFAWPPESQFNAESIEHFCFPLGVPASVQQPQTR